MVIKVKSADECTPRPAMNLANSHQERSINLLLSKRAPAFTAGPRAAQGEVFLRTSSSVVCVEGCKVSVRRAPDLQDGLACQGHLATRKQGLRENCLPGAHLGPLFCLSDSHCGQEPWLQNQAVAMGAAPISPGDSSGHGTSTVRLLGPHTRCGDGAGDRRCVW